MPLNHNQQRTLKNSISGYSFPAIYYDFTNNRQINPKDMRVLEEYILRLLRSNNIADVKYGLANVLYWGYANVGFRDTRVNIFINNTTDKQIESFQELVLNGTVPDTITIKKLNLPEFSGMSFVSKIMMFLDPINYCVLDKHVSKLGNPGCMKALSYLAFGPYATTIRISKNNQNVYNAWRQEC